MKKISLVIGFLLSINLFSADLNTILTGFEKAIQIPNLTGDFSVKLISQNGDIRKIKADVFQKLSNEDQMNRLFKFTYPPTIRDTGFLIHSFYTENKENKMWIYLPIVKKIKRIILSSSGGGYFMGSDFTYSDFISKARGSFTEELISDGDMNGKTYYRIKVYGKTQKEKEAFGYGYVINYFDKNDYFLYGRDYYEYSGDLLKTYRVNKVKKFDTYIYPTEIEMTNVQTNHKSIISVSNISFSSIQDNIFTTRNLQR